MEDQGKILIGIFSGLIGIGVVIGLSILGFKKREKNKKDEVWYKFQKDALFKSTLYEAKNQLDGMWVTVGELKTDLDEGSEQLNKISKTVNKLLVKNAERDALEAKQQEEAKRLHFEALVRKLHEILDPQVNTLKQELDQIGKFLEEHEKLIDHSNRVFISTANTFKILQKMKKEDKEIEDETDPDVKDAMISAQLEELRDLRNGLVGDCNNDELNKPSNVLIPNTHGQEI